MPQLSRSAQTALFELLADHYDAIIMETFGIGGIPEYEDTSFVVEAINNSKRIGKLNEFLHYYVIHNQSETTIRDERVFDIVDKCPMCGYKFTEEDYDSYN